MISSASVSVGAFAGGAARMGVGLPAREPLVVLLGDRWRWDDDSLKDSALGGFWAEAQKANVVVRARSMPTCLADGAALLRTGSRGGAGGSLLLGEELVKSGVFVSVMGHHAWKALWDTEPAVAGGDSGVAYYPEAVYHSAAPRVFADLVKNVVITDNEQSVFGVNQGRDRGGFPFLNQVVFVDMSAFARGQQTQVLSEILDWGRSSNWNIIMASISDIGDCSANYLLNNRDYAGDLIDANSSGEADSEVNETNSPRLQAYAALGPRFPSGGTYSGSTHQTGLIQTADITATILGYYNLVIPQSVNGVELRSEGALSISDLSSASRRAAIIRPAQYWFIPTLGILLTLVLLTGVWSLNRRTHRLGSQWEPPSRLLKFWRTLGLFMALVPGATFWVNLVPWWNLGPANTDIAVQSFAWFGGLLPFGVAAGLAGIFTALNLTSLLGPISLISVLSLAVGFLDPVLGSPMMLDSLIGSQSTWGGRFYGIDNMMFAIFLTGALMLISLVYSIANGESRKATVPVLVVLALTVILTDASPLLGADFGGVLVTIPAFAILFTRFYSKPIKPLLAALIFLSTVLVAALFVYLDWLKPVAERTHLGNLVDTVISGQIWQVMLSKFTQLWTAGWSAGQIITAVSAFFVIIFLIVAPLLRNWLNPYQRDYSWLWGSQLKEKFRYGLKWSTAEKSFLAAWITAMVLGMLVNDSSVLLGLAGFTVTAPACLAQVCHKYLTESPETSVLT